MYRSVNGVGNSVNNFEKIKNFSAIQMMNFIVRLLNTNILSITMPCGGKVCCAGCTLVKQCTKAFLARNAKVI